MRTRASHYKERRREANPKARCCCPSRYRSCPWRCNFAGSSRAEDLCNTVTPDPGSWRQGQPALIQIKSPISPSCYYTTHGPMWTEQDESHAMETLTNHPRIDIELIPDLNSLSTGFWRPSSCSSWQVKIDGQSFEQNTAWQHMGQVIGQHVGQHMATMTATTQLSNPTAGSGVGGFTGCRSGLHGMEYL